MAGSMNKATILGNVGRDPDVKTMNSGDKVANFSIATSESWTKDGERKEKTTWHNIVVWGKLADIVERYVHKGSKVLVEGMIEMRKYEKDGIERTAMEIVLRGFNSTLLLLDGKPTEGGSSSPDRGLAMRDDVDADSIPFATSDSIW